MPTAHEIYQEHIRKRLAIKGYAVWPPGRVLQLGDVVELAGRGDFKKRTDLGQLGIEPNIEEGQPQPMSATSEDIRKAVAQASAEAASIAKGAVELLLGRTGVVIFEVRDFQHVQLGNLAEIADRVVKLWDKGKGAWKRSWCLVDQVWRASTGTIIVSESSDVRVNISAGVSGTIPGLEALANPSIGTQVEVHGEGVTKVIGGSNLTPMFTCMALNFFKTDLKPIAKRGGDQEEDEAPRLVRLTLDEVEAAWRSPVTDD
jgi:hypothetical protein